MTATVLSVDVALRQAVDFHKAGRIQDAERLYRAILQAQPNHPDANHNLGVLAVQMSRPAEGLPHFKAALEVNPDSMQYWLSYIDALIVTGQADAARQALEQARRRGLQGKAAEALAVRLEQPDTSAGPSAPTAEEVARLEALFNQGRYAEAEAQARAMTGRFPRDGFGWKALGACLKEQGRLEDAIAPTERAIAWLPEDAEAHGNLGIILGEIGRLAEAEASYRRALELKPDSAGIHNNLGAVLRALGRLSDAEASLRRALELKPDYAEAHNNLGLVLKEQGRQAESEASCRRALEHKPDYAMACLNLGLALEAQGRLEEAVAQYERACVLAPGFDDAKFALCQALYFLSRVDSGKARDAADRARRLFPEDSIVLRGISGILGRTDISGDESLYTRELFDRFAATFDAKLKSIGYDMPKRMAQALGLGGSGASRSADVLDAGCGTGLSGEHLRPVARTLTGVDLSPNMLRVAREKRLYDALHAGDVIDFMTGNPASFDIVFSSDVVSYIGDVAALLGAAALALRPGGVLAISAESLDPDDSGDGFALQPSGRYQHSERYLKRSFLDAGYSVEKITRSTIRREAGTPVGAWIVIARKP